MADGWDTATVKVEGLDALVKGFSAIEKSLGRELKAELREVGGIVRDEAKMIARAKGLYETGALVGGIKVGATRSTVSVYETASRRSSLGHTAYRKTARKSRVASHISGGGGISDYPYPVVYEFGGRGKGARGPRAFMYPALVAKEREVIAGMERMLDRIASAEGFRKGGLL